MRRSLLSPKIKTRASRIWRRHLADRMRMLARIAMAAAVLLAVFIAALRWIDPPTSSVLMQRNWGAPPDARLSFTWRPLAEIAPAMSRAVIAGEDQRFFQHHGLDFIEMAKSLRENAWRPRGASTITQQVAKNLLLWNARSYPRKLIEAVLAVYIDLTWSKRRVLEVYLNIAQFGEEVYGVENAARHFFNKPARRLTRREAARLAAVLPNPIKRIANAPRPSEQFIKRQRWILRHMHMVDLAPATNRR